MDDYQREEAIDLLVDLTDFGYDEIEEYSDLEIEAWLHELGYEWDETPGYMGAWVEVQS